MDLTQRDWLSLMDKPCTVCGLVKLLGDFKPCKRMRLGVASECRACSKASNDRYRVANKEKINARAREAKRIDPVRFRAYKARDYAAHKEGYARRARASAERNADRAKGWAKTYQIKHAEALRARRALKADNLAAKRAANRAHLSQSFREWTKKNPGYDAARKAKRRSAKKKATPPWINSKDFLPIYKTCNDITRVTGVEHQVDHIYPLQGIDSCGLHVPWNLQILTKSQNVRKKNRPPTQEDIRNAEIQL